MERCSTRPASAAVTVPMEAGPAVASPQKGTRARRVIDTAFRDPCCGGLLVIIPVVALVSFGRWVISTGNLWAISGLVGGIAAVIALFVVLWRRSARRCQPLS
jgi:membrane associated rhomboid family serine protease